MNAAASEQLPHVHGCRAFESCVAAACSNAWGLALAKSDQQRWKGGRGDDGRWVRRNFPISGSLPPWINFHLIRGWVISEFAAYPLGQSARPTETQLGNAQHRKRTKESHEQPEQEDDGGSK